MLVNSKWKWRISGKHPSAKDYIIAGKSMPVLEGITKWIEMSYEKIFSKKTDHSHYHSYRFWMKSPDKHYLICGLVKDSCDKIGRSYPLTIIGTGYLKYWEHHLELIPFACEKTWIQMESILARNETTIEEFKENLSLIHPPQHDWKNFQFQKSQNQLSSIDHSFEKNIIYNKNSFIKLLPVTFQDDSLKLPINWHSFLKHKKKIPNSVFMGGSTKQIMLAAYYRPLDEEDFSNLWVQNKQ